MALLLKGRRWQGAEHKVVSTNDLCLVEACHISTELRSRDELVRRFLSIEGSGIAYESDDHIVLRWRSENTVDLDPILAKTVNVISPYSRERLGRALSPQMVGAKFVDSHFSSI